MRTRLAAIAGAGALLVLTGCGTDLGPQMHPGAAAVVGDQTISLDEVDDLSKDVCGFFAKMAQAPSSMSSVRSQVLDVKVAEIKARDFAEEFDIDPRQIIRSQKASVEKQMEQLDLTDTQQSAYRDLMDSVLYVTAVNAEVGQQAAATSGQKADPQAAVQQGAGVVNDWAKRIDVETDPRFAVQGQEGTQLDPAPLSVAVSDQAVQAADPEALEAHLDTLPASQKCE